MGRISGGAPSGGASSGGLYGSAGGNSSGSTGWANSVGGLLVAASVGDSVELPVGDSHGQIQLEQQCGC